MRNYKILFIVFFILGVSIAYYFWSSNKETPVNTSDLTIKSSNIDKKPTYNTTVKENHQQSKTDENIHDNPIIDRVKAFDSDPVVDAELIKINLNHCLKIINSDNYNVPTQAYRAIDNQSDDQKLYEKEINTYCEELNLKHPEYMLSNEDEIFKLSKSVQSDSEMGKILNNKYNDIYMDLESFDLKSKVHYIKNANPSLLFKLKSYFMPVLGIEFHNDLASIINSNDYTYIGLVSMSAFDLYACDAGANCDKYSNKVSEYCLLRNLCGNDFNDILYNKMPLGIRSDILLVFNHIKETLD